MAVLSFVRGGVIVIVTAFFPAMAAAHGKVALEDDVCVRRVGGNLVHFNAYQPQHEAKAQYCTDIPGEGETFLVLDLVDPVLRTLPVGVRLVRGSDGSQEEQTVAYWPPVIHPDGVLRGEAHLSKGLYTFVIMPEGFSSSSYLLRVQQTDYGKIGQKAIGPLMILLVIAMIGYELSKSRRWGSGGQQAGKF
ncbi:MAG: hypothetical protein NNA23_07715 [Nitrospira sp.]|nr:hypothetical protein [Nitrospira sp.]MCP9464798.1 hypothetical protein [Nitrospira sp.]